MPHPEAIPPSPDAVVEANVTALRQRSHHGIAKYGVMLTRTDLDRRAWIQHALEEALDLANYLQAELHRLDREAAETPKAGPAGA
jgi:hypothetical protein